MLSEAKHLDASEERGMEILRCAQDDNKGRRSC
jgi:hypothetical protein